MQKIDVQINKSKIYFVPLFHKVIPVSYFKLLINTYFWYDDFKEETFCLLYKFDGKVEGTFGSRKGFTVYEKDILIANDLYMGHIDYGEYVLYKFYLTDELLKLRDILIEGKYSGLPKEAKETILDFQLRMYGPNEREFISKILYKDEELSQEIADKYNVSVNSVKENSSIINPDNEKFSNFIK